MLLMNRPKVAVLMSTYNGEKYIREQIDSILVQKDVDVTLFIRDDGSTDETRSIILNYIKDHKNIHLYYDKKNLRPGMSFLKLLCYVVKYKEPFDYYAFSDQDDIWLEEKLIKGAEAISDSNEPMLYCSNQILYIDGKQNGYRLNEPPLITLMSHLSSNAIYGCTMVLNYALAKIVAYSKKPGQDFLYNRNHDAWTVLITLVCGKVVYDNDSYILYRIHDNNVVGVRERSFCQRLIRFKKQTIKNLRRNSARYILNAFSDIEFADREYIRLMAEYNKSLTARLALIKKADICKTDKESKAVFALKVLMGYI